MQHVSCVKITAAAAAATSITTTTTLLPPLRMPILRLFRNPIFWTENHFYDCWWWSFFSSAFLRAEWCTVCFSRPTIGVLFTTEMVGWVTALHNVDKLRNSGICALISQNHRKVNFCSALSTTATCEAAWKRKCASLRTDVLRFGLIETCFKEEFKCHSFLKWCK